MSDDGKIWVRITAEEKAAMTGDEFAHFIMEHGIRFDPRRPISYFTEIKSGATLVSQEKDSTMNDQPKRTVADVTLVDMRKAVGAELGKSRGAYPRFVAEGRMTQAQADEKILVFEALYGKLKNEEAAQVPQV